MPDDLVAKLRAAIEAKAAKARAATPGPWRIDPNRPNIIPEPVGIDWVGVAGTRRDVPVFTGQLASRDRQADRDAEHIADNDPASVLRMCDAHLRIVDEHSDQHECAGGSNAWALPYVGCDVVIALAEGYGLTTEGEQ